MKPTNIICPICKEDGIEAEMKFYAKDTFYHYFRCKHKRSHKRMVEREDKPNIQEEFK